MRTPASFKGHPIHTILVAYPIGLWTFSLICDLVHIVTGREGARIAALYSLAGGLAGALAAAVPGLIDLLSLHDPKTKRVGIWHMSLNLLAVAVFAVSFGLRLAGPGTGLPVALSVLGVILIGVSGFLGGELVYTHGVGVHGPTGSGSPAGPSRHAA